MMERTALAKSAEPTGPTARPLAAVGDRKVSVLPHVPSHRTLHLVDVENEAGGTNLARSDIDRVLGAFAQVANYDLSDHMIIGCNPGLALLVKTVAKAMQVVHQEGPDGADLALLAAAGSASWIAERYHRVVIGSGDHIFADLARALVRLGVPVQIVSRRGSISAELYTIRGVTVHWLDCELPSSDAA